jgi:hypothetical protein
MATSNVDRNSDHMHQMWGTDHLATDYVQNQEPKKIIQEIMHDEIAKNKFKLTEQLHSKIRNDVDYDDWEYGTEPNYGGPWK